MRGRESGMPEEALWCSFFDADEAVARLGCAADGAARVAEFGSGYGTFTLPVARRTRGCVHAFDIDPELVAALRRKAAAAGLANVEASVRDFLAAGTGLADACVDHAMLYNILHVAEAVDLLREAHRIVRPGGSVSIMHWKHDAATPRGPPLAIRPRAAECRSWAGQAGLQFVREQDLAGCCPWHYGLVLARPPT